MPLFKREKHVKLHARIDIKFCFKILGYTMFLVISFTSYFNLVLNFLIVLIWSIPFQCRVNLVHTEATFLF